MYRLISSLIFVEKISTKMNNESREDDTTTVKTTTSPDDESEDTDYNYY